MTFGQPIIVRDDIAYSDKPWIAVDNATGTGQHDVYLTCSTIQSPFGLWLTVSTDANGANWSAPVPIREADGINVTQVQSAIAVIGPDHVAYVVWLERTADGINWLKMRKVQNRGATLGTIYPVRQLVTTDPTYGNLQLKRSNGAASDDTFRAFPFPVVAVNPDPAKASHLYVTYADKAQNPDPNDKADVFFVRSTDGGATWTSPVRVSTVPNNDQWMPVMAVKPDGTKLFIAWYDRRNDSNNSLIDVYGRWGTIAADGTVTFGTEFRITTTSFPPVFAGTLPDNTIQGHYDPVYPPGGVDLHWWYPEWPQGVTTDPTYKDHVGEYEGAWAEGQYVYTTWKDNRLTASGTQFGRNQSDIRLVRITWP